MRLNDLGIEHINLNESIVLEFTNQLYAVRSNSVKLIQALKNYFKEWVSDKSISLADTVVDAYDGFVPDFNVDFKEYRESPEKRMKECYADLEGFRLVKKIKTGVHFLVGDKTWKAFGPLEQNANQLINFLNAIFMEINLSGNSFLFHAAGVAHTGNGIVIAAQSGKGKSTTSLLLMNQGLDFISNDRVILQKDTDKYTMIGVPKHPRVNPGTLLNNDKVTHLLRDPQRFESLSKEEIWNFEEKYDVVIPEVYGTEKFPLKSVADALLIIDWGEDENELSLEQFNLADRPDLMPAIMKKPSLMTPNIHSAKKGLDAEEYLDFLVDLPVFVLRGQINPRRGLELVMDKFFSA